MSGSRKTVMVGLSGGVDSSVAAYLLKEQGYVVVGATMEIFNAALPFHASGKDACYGPGEKEDVASAASVCRRLKIPFHTIDLKEEYQSFVLDYFRREYLDGRTPNPCIVCNQKVKFGFLLEKASAAGIRFDAFATGHYARVQKSGAHYLLKKAVDALKDQTYFLYGLSQKQLSRTLFPLGELRKQEVREIAFSIGLDTAGRAESQDFIAGGDYSPLFKPGEIRPGDIVDETGKVLGRHPGIVYYTVGQRRGLGIASRHRLFVRQIDPDNNRIVVSEKEQLYAKRLIAAQLNLIGMEKLEESCRVTAKIRLRHPGAEATVYPHGNDTIELAFDRPQESVTPGQSVVFYRDDLVLGGGVIQQAL